MFFCSNQKRKRYKYNLQIILYIEKKMYGCNKSSFFLFPGPFFFFHCDVFFVKDEQENVNMLIFPSHNHTHVNMQELQRETTFFRAQNEMHNSFPKTVWDF